MQPSKPALEAKMEKISTATIYFPLVLRYVGTKDSQTLQKTSMLKVMNLASLKLSGNFRAKKATMKLTAARKPMYPNIQ